MFLKILFSLIYLQSLFGGYFERLDSQVGLSHNTVYEVYQDKDGYIWIGTENGLNRYDGYEFKVFQHINGDSTSLSNNIVRSIIEDSSGALWVGTFNGFNKFDRRKKTFQRIVDFPALKEHKRVDIQHIRKDSNSNFWFTVPGAICQFNPFSEKISIFELDKYGNRILPKFNHYKLNIDKENNLWIYATEGKVLAKYNIEDSTSTIFDHEFNYAPYIDPKSENIWVDDSYSIIEEDFKKIKFLPEDLLHGLTNIRLLEDSNGRVWIGTENGLYIAKGQKFEKVSLNSSQTGMLSNRIWKIYEDNSGKIWVGTLNGLYRWNGKAKLFSHFTPSEKFSGEQQGIDLVTNFSIMGDQLITGTFGGGIYSLTENEISLKKNEDIHINLTGNEAQVWSTYIPDKNKGIIYLGTESGLLKSNVNNNSISRIQLPLSEGSLPVIFTIIEENDHLVWLAGDEDLYQYDIQKNEITNYFDFSIYENISTLQSLLITSDNKLFIGTSGIGLWNYDPGTNQLSKLAISEITGTSILDAFPIWSIHQDLNLDELIWLATGGGLFQYNKENDELNLVAGEDLVIYSILEDKSGKFWMGTSLGLASYNKSDDSFRIFMKEHGIRNDEFNRRAAYKSDDGTFYFGGIRGITFFKPSEIKFNESISPVRLTSINVFHRGNPKNISEYKKEIQLDWYENTIELEFSVLSFYNVKNNRYKYRLYPLEEQWVEAGNRRFARYAQIPPGEYNFQVLGANDDRNWNTEGASATIVIKAPYWQTSWFKMLILGLVVLVAWNLYRFRVKKVIEMERMRLKIAEDLHDDLGSKLGSIMLLSEYLWNKTSISIEVKKKLKRINETASRLGNDLQEIVWFVDPKHDKTEELRWKMKNAASDILSACEWELKWPDKISIDHKNIEFRKNLYLIFKEVIYNSAKHAQAEKVHIEMRKDDDRIIMKICDNGRGFDISSNPDGNGLNNIRKRSKELDANLKINSKPGEGTSIMVEFEA